MWVVGLDGDVSVALREVNDVQYDQVRELLLQQWTYTGGPNEDKAAVFYHDDAELEFPQSGECFRGKENIQGWRQVYPMKLDFHPQQIRGGGDLWVAEAVLTYDGTSPVHVIKIMQFSDDKIARETLYFADPFTPPEWREPWAEREPRHRRQDDLPEHIAGGS